MTGGLIVKVLELLVGMLCIYGAALVYPGDRNKFHNALDALWVRVDDAAKTGDKWYAAAIREVAALTGKALDGIWGSQVLSLRGFCVSICLGFTFILGNDLQGTLHMMSASWPVPSQRATISTIAWKEEAFLAVFGGLVVLQSLFKRLPPFLFPMATALSVAGAISVLHRVLFGRQIDVYFPSLAGGVSKLHEVLVIAATLSVSCLTDFAVVAAIRLILRKAAPKLPMLTVSLLAIVSCVLYYGINYYMWQLQGPWMHVALRLVVGRASGEVLPSVLVLVLYANSVDWWVSVAFFGVAASVLVNRLAGGLISRVVYAIANDRVLDTRRGWLWTVGIALLGDVYTGSSGHLIELMRK